MDIMTNYFSVNNPGTTFLCKNLIRTTAELIYITNQSISQYYTNIAMTHHMSTHNLIQQSN